MEFEMPQYSMSFDDSPEQVIKGNSAALNDLTQKVLKSMNPAPTIEGVPDTFVKLPAGLIVDGEVIQEAEVRELTGKDEEELAKAKNSNNPAKYVNTLLKCGVVSIGDVKATQENLDSLIQGDLDSLLMGIRRATFGDSFEVFGVTCNSCGQANDIGLDLKDIPVKELDDPSVREYEVELRKGRKALVKFPTGHVQNEIFKKQRTVPEMNSLTLAECVIGFVAPDGSYTPSNGLADVKALGLGDRKIIQDYIYDNQPGPRYDQVTAKCSSCESEVAVPLNVGILFREL